MTVTRARKEKKSVTVMLMPNVHLTVNVYQQVLYTKQKSQQVTAKKTKEYIGMTAGMFKKRYANHKK